MAEDLELEKGLQTGDVYTEDAKAFFGLPAHYTKKDVKPDARKQSKIIHLASQYAAGTPAVYGQALSEDRTLKYSAVSQLHHGFKKKYFRTVAYWFEEMEQVRKCGYSESRLMGRRRYYPREPPITEVANYPNQSTAADVANVTAIELDEKLTKYVPSAKLLIQLHDAFYVEAPKKHERTVREILKECMEKPREICGRKWTFPTEIKSDVSWGYL